jgi:hypothetical protein
MRSNLLPFVQNDAILDDDGVKADKDVKSHHEYQYPIEVVVQEVLNIVVGFVALGHHSDDKVHDDVNQHEELP